MSFIFGIVNLDGKCIPDNEIRRLSSAVKWEGFHEKMETAENYAVGYCHHPNRDSKAAIYQHESLLILADIRIYNCAELKKKIEFDSPEEAFAKLYLRYGKECPNQINGDFAVVVIDRQKNEVHLFRDHIGARPLTYGIYNNQIIFASHEFGLVKSELVPSSLHEEYLIRSLLRINEYYEHTAFRNIFKIAPGCCATFSNGSCATTKYWFPEKINAVSNITFEETVVRLRKLLSSATSNRIENGVTGTHVSGGLDSTGVACLLAEHISDKSKLIGYSWSPEQEVENFKGLDEKQLIAFFCEDKGVLVKYLDFTPGEYIQNALLPEFENMHNELTTLRVAGKDDVRSLFSGWGGDEFVSLSNRGTCNHLFFNFKWWSLGKFLSKSGFKKAIMLLRSEVLPLLIPFGLLPSYEFTEWKALRFFRLKFIHKHRKVIFCHSRENIFGYGNRRHFMLNLLYNYHLPARMDNWCFFAEKYGIEYKYPLLDKELLEFWFSIPIQYTCQLSPPRKLFREALKGVLTEQIRNRKGKDEGQLVTYFQFQQKEGRSYLVNLLLNSSHEKKLSFLRVKSILRSLKKAPNGQQFDEFRRISKALFFLRMENLVKKYLPRD